MITTTHEHCATCDWLGREAERTANAEGRGHWTSETQADGATHVAHYFAGDGVR